MPSLLLQKPSKSSRKLKTTPNVLHVVSSYDKKATLMASFEKEEGFKIGKQKNVTKRFSNLIMFKGKINAALNLLANENSAEVLSIVDATLNSLKAS